MIEASTDEPMWTYIDPDDDQIVVDYASDSAESGAAVYVRTSPWGCCVPAHRIDDFIAAIRASLESANACAATDAGQEER